MMAGLATVAVAIYVWFSKADFSDLLPESLFSALIYVMIGFGGAVAFIALAGCIGSMAEKRKMLNLYIICLVLIFLGEAAIGIVGFVFYQQIRTILDDNVKVAILDNYGFEKYKAITEAINMMQEKLECCGYDEQEDWASADYYTDITKATERGSAVAPVSCCKTMSEAGCNNQFGEKLFPQGCRSKVEDLLKANMKLVGGFCIGIALFQLIGVVMAFVLLKKTKEHEETF